MVSLVKPQLHQWTSLRQNMHDGTVALAVSAGQTSVRQPAEAMASRAKVSLQEPHGARRSQRRCCQLAQVNACLKNDIHSSDGQTARWSFEAAAAIAEAAWSYVMLLAGTGRTVV